VISRTVAVLIAAGAMALLPLPATAKGLEQTLAIVSGPGLEPPLILQHDQWGIPHSESSPQAVVIGRLIGDHPKVSQPPAGRLGPAFEIHYQLSAYDPQADWPVLSLVHQRLYPYATPGPVTYTPPQFWRNPFGPNRIEPGWQRFPSALVERLQRFGLPEQPPVAPAAGDMAFPLGLAAASMAMVIAAVASRRRDPLLAP
jgi:hypothetical protein